MGSAPCASAVSIAPDRESKPPLLAEGRSLRSCCQEPRDPPDWLSGPPRAELVVPVRGGVPTDRAGTDRLKECQGNLPRHVIRSGNPSKESIHEHHHLCRRPDRHHRVCLVVLWTSLKRRTRRDNAGSGFSCPSCATPVCPVGLGALPFRQSPVSAITRRFESNSRGLPGDGRSLRDPSARPAKPERLGGSVHLMSFRLHRDLPGDNFFQLEHPS
jgi:hypothetical protein